MSELITHINEEDHYTTLTTSNTNKIETSSKQNYQQPQNRSDKVAVLWKVNIIITVILCAVCIVFVSLSAVMYHQIKQLQMKGNSFNEDMENIELNSSFLKQEVENVLREKALNQCISVGYVFDEYADICYKIYHSKVTWKSANNFCRDQGGRLLILDNRKKFDRIEKILSSENDKDAVSVGVRYNPLLQKFLWINGKEIESYVWDENQPDKINDGRVKKCGAIGIIWVKKRPYHLHNISCTFHKIEFICEKSFY